MGSIVQAARPGGPVVPPSSPMIRIWGKRAGQLAAQEALGQPVRRGHGVVTARSAFVLRHQGRTELPQRDQSGFGDQRSDQVVEPAEIDGLVGASAARGPTRIRAVGIEGGQFAA